MTPHTGADVLNVLLVDRDEGDHRLARRLFSELSPGRFRLDRASDLGEAQVALSARRYDLYLIDDRMGPSDRLDPLRLATGHDGTALMILLTRGGGYKGPSASREGFAEFLEAGPLDASLVDRAIRHTLHRKWHSEQLERKVRDRTAELARANDALLEEITERKRKEAALLDADRRKDEFLVTLAHELRNPLVPICNALEILRIADDRPEIREPHRAMIGRQAQQMVRLLDDMLDILRISRGKIHLYRERVELGAIIEGAVESIRPTIDRLRHSFAIILPDPHLTLEADSVRLSRILLNLLQNACKFTEAGGEIVLRVEEEGDTVRIRVKDSGIGIAAEQIPNLFQLFTQVHPPNERSRGGLGIGLSLAHRLVELHGGTLEVFSDGPGLGSEFVVSLPIRREDGRAGEVHPD